MPILLFFFFFWEFLKYCFIRTIIAVFATRFTQIFNYFWAWIANSWRLNWIYLLLLLYGIDDNQWITLFNRIIIEWITFPHICIAFMKIDIFLGFVWRNICIHNCWWSLQVYWLKRMRLKASVVLNILKWNVIYFGIWRWHNIDRIISQLVFICNHMLILNITPLVPLFKMFITSKILTNFQVFQILFNSFFLLMLLMMSVFLQFRLLDATLT